MEAGMLKLIVRVSVIVLLITGSLLCQGYALAVDRKSDYRLKQKIEKAIVSLENKRGNIRRTAKNDLINWGADSVKPLIAVVRNWKNQPADLRVVCVDILGRIKDKKAVPVIIDVLNEKKMTMRCNAARALGNIGDKRAAPALIRLLGDHEWQVRFYAVEALGKIGDKDASKPLANLLLIDSSQRVRFAAIEGLAALDSRAEYRAVLEAFSDKNLKIRSYAIDLASSWMVQGAVDAIINRLKSDRSNKVRASSAYALGIYASYDAVPALIDALNDDYKNVRICAIRALEKISGQDYGKDEQKWNHWFELNKDEAKE